MSVNIVYMMLMFLRDC